MVTRKELLAEARTWVGTQWRHAGRSKQYGVDCGGVVVETCRVVGLPFAQPDIYGHVPDGAQLQACIEQVCTRVQIGHEKPGDLLLMRWSVMPTHVAFVADRGYPLSIIHAYAQSRRVVEHDFSREWRDRVVASYTWLDLED